MNNLIWTSISDNIPIQTVSSWIISLRNEGQYQGEVLILNYGANKDVLEFIKKYNVNIVDCNLENYNQRLIVNYRYIDIIPILENYKNYNIAHFDVDIWFQDNINSLFHDIEKSNGCLFSIEIYSEEDKSSFNNYLDDDLILKNLYTKRKYGGYINGGFIAGKTENILNKFNEFKNLIQKKIINNYYGADQSYFRYSFNKNDKIMLKYNFMVNEKNINNIIKKENQLYYNEEKLIGIHLSEKKKKRKKINFDNLYYHNKYKRNYET